MPHDFRSDGGKPRSYWPMVAVLSSPFILLLVLAALSLLARLLLLQPAEPPTAAGAPIMGVGIFAIGALQHIPSLRAPTTEVITLELLIIWIYLAAAFARSYLVGHFRAYLDDIDGCFGVGTWIAATAVVITLLNAHTAEWETVAVVLALVMVVLWLGYMVLAAVRFPAVAAPSAQSKVAGRILLTTVSTQSLVIVAELLRPGALPGWLVLGLVGLGCLFYAFGLVLLARRYLFSRDWSLADDWDNTNCIIHGAMSITGVAAIQSGLVPSPVIVGTWLWVVVMFAIVEGIELARMRARVRLDGWVRGVFSYHVSQWARNFTFGMFYFFTLQTYAQPGRVTGVEAPWLVAVQAAIVDWGQYVVLFFLLVEISLYLWQNVRSRYPSRRVAASEEPA